LVRDPNGGVHRIQLGDYMGTVSAIASINENQIELVEIVPMVPAAGRARANRAWEAVSHEGIEHGTSNCRSERGVNTQNIGG
jgi:hypothetical protein